jgi:hypothetical protein
MHCTIIPSMGVELQDHRCHWSDRNMPCGVLDGACSAGLPGVSEVKKAAHTRPTCGHGAGCTPLRLATSSLRHSCMKAK